MKRNPLPTLARATAALATSLALLVAQPARAAAPNAALPDRASQDAKVLR